MDVSFSNVLEGARQYFQGLPAGTGSTAGPTYSSTSENHRVANDTEQNAQNQLPSAFWQSQHENQRPPTRESTPVQRPSSHHSDSSRPASHHSQMGFSPSHDQGRLQQHNPYQATYQESAQQQQSFQFPRPHSREAPSNVSQHQNHQHYQPHIVQTSAYHPSSSPQITRVPSRHSEQNITPPTSQSYHQFPSSPNYQNYQQTRSFYPVHSQSQSQVSPNNNPHKVPSSQPHVISSQENPYYKNLQTYIPRSSSSTLVTSQHINQTIPQSSQSTNHPVSTSQASHNHVSQEMKYDHSSMMQTQATSQPYRTTHNLPPIASLSSVNYHSSRTRDVQRQGGLNGYRNRTISSGSHSTSTPSSLLTTSPASDHQSHVRTTSGASMIQPQANLSQISYSSTNSQQIYSNSYQNQNQLLSNQHYQYPTKTTQSYNHVVMTTAPNVSSYNVTVQSHLSNSNSSSFYPPNKTTRQGNHQLLIQKSQLPVITSQHNQPHVIADVDLTVNPNSTPVIKHKRESPLDLSVKTVRTPADSTHEDIDQESRMKNASAFRATSQLNPGYNYPTYDTHPVSQRSAYHRPMQVATASAPKVDFSPDFSLTHSSVPTHKADLRRSTVQSTDKNSMNQGAYYDKTNHQHHRQQYVTPSRYPTVSVPSAAHVTSYIRNLPPVKKPSDNLQRESLPRIDFPGHAHKTSAIYSAPTHEIQRKRAADTAPTVIPNKAVKVDNWKQTIDQQIEQRFSTYKQQQEQKQSTQSKPTLVNGYGQCNDEKSLKDLYSYQRPDHISPHHMYTNASQYQPPQSSHNQTYVPSVSGHQYPSYTAYTSQQQNVYTNHQQLTRTNSNSSLHTAGSKTNHKTAIGGAANKHVLSLLRNSLESKGAKEAQKKLEQEQQNKSYDHIHHARPEVQQPSTDVTAPLQPKPGFIGRQNVSPFTPTNLPEGNYNNTPYKLHIPRAVDSVNFETDTKNNNPLTDKQVDDSNHVILSNHNNTNSDLDGLAAFLAARIRTKAELKQVGPARIAYNSVSNTRNNNDTNSDSDMNQIQLQNIIENQLKTPVQQEALEDTTPNNNSSTGGVIPPKQVKEKQMYSPRRRLFSRNEDEPGNSVPKAPPRDKSGLRSSSETSVFDFPDTDDEGEMPILERQSLEDMRRDRKTCSKTSVPEPETHLEEVSKALSPEDDIFEKACNSFMEELKSGVGKKVLKKKKMMIPESSSRVEEIETIDDKQNDEIKIKTEIDDTSDHTSASLLQDTVMLDDMKTESVDMLQQIKQEDCDNSVLDVRSDDIPTVMKVEKSTQPVHEEPSLHDVKLESGIQECKNEENSSKKKVTRESNSSQPEASLSSTVLSTSKPEKSPQKKIEVPLVIRPAKKPAFGDGSDFYPGWEEEVCKYKKSLRMPPSLIQITRPPQYHRLSTSLPDLDPCPYSPADNNEFAKNKLPKVKSEPLDSDPESNSGFNLFSNKNNNYDSEGSSSIVSLPNTPKENTSILDKLLERYGGRKRKKYKKKDEGPKIIPKSNSDLLPTPSLEIQTQGDSDSKKSEAVIAGESALLGFRKKTINTFKETFITQAKKIVGVNEHLTTVVLNSRTRKETRVLKQRATIKEVFGEDRPASAPPVTCVNEVKIKEEPGEVDNNTTVASDKDMQTEDQNESGNMSSDTKQILKNRILNKDRKRTSHLLKTLVDKKMTEMIKSEPKEEADDESVDNDMLTKLDCDAKSESQSVDGDESSISGKKRSKFRNIRRKCSSGFDYIRKKKKQNKKDNIENDPAIRIKKRSVVPKSSPESIQDIQKEIKSWVLNKGVGETHLHRAARLGYTDITVYCLEKMECIPSPKDNAGYTPLHEACSRGHLDIAKLLLAYGANVSESAQGGIRPLHEAVENGFVEVVRLLLSYGADPMLATYAGLTPLALASDEATMHLLQNHMADMRGESKVPWFMYGPASCFDPKDTGYNILDDVPQTDPSSEDEDIDFEVADCLLPNLYTLKGEPPNDRWILLQDLSNMLKIKSRDALLRQICSASPASSSSSQQINYKSVLRELKMSDFLEQAHCCQFLNAGEKVNTRASKIALVKYTDKVKELLNVEKVLITLR